MLLKKIDEEEKRKVQGLGKPQQKMSKSRLAKLGCSIMHREKSGGVKTMESQFVSIFITCSDFQ